MQAKLADMYTSPERLPGLRVCGGARGCDKGRIEADRCDPGGFILYASEHATQMALQAIQALGGNKPHQQTIGRAPAARCQALRDRGRHLRDRRMLIGRELLRPKA